MNLTTHAIKRTALAAAVTTTLGLAVIPGQTSAANIGFNVSGWFTMINAAGDGALVNGDASGNEYYGNRTAVTGTMTFDTATNSGTMALQPFSFFGSGDAAATNITFEDIDGPGGASTLMVGNMGFDWNNNIGIPVSIAWDGDGLLDAINQGLAVGDTIAATGADFACDANVSCATPATDDFLFNFGKFSYTLPIGASPVATTTFNTTDIGTIELGTNPSGTIPLIADSIGGSPMKAGPFPGFNANFDFDNLSVTSVPGGGSITPPADVEASVPQVPGPPKTQSVDLGVPTNVSPPGTAEYCLETLAACNSSNLWINSAGNNTTNVPITETVNIQIVNWRADNGSALAIQTVTSTVDDTVPPDVTSEPMDITVDVTSTGEEVCFSNDAIGHLTATDIWDTDPAILYSLNGFDFFPSDPVEDCSDQFGPNANTVFWRAVDTAGNIASYEQTVTLNLPGGIVGKACVVNLSYNGCDEGVEDCPNEAGFRNLAGNFIMRNPNGSQVGVTDNTVTGGINTTLLCTEQGTDICPDEGATLETTQPFEGLLWKATPIWLYGPGEWTFEACPGDASTQCDGSPRPLSMTVLDATANNGIPQLGAHMLFEWGNTQAIDVVVVWDADCGSKQLTTTDPDGDGILGTPMVDGPFIGFNAAFDQSATGVNTAGEPVPLIADGGYITSIPAYRNPVQGGSPLPLDFVRLDASDFPKDPEAGQSCIGGCYAFETDGLIDATDNNGDYQFVQVVLPLDQAIPFWSLYRKFDEASQQWKTLVPDSRNNVKTALKDDAGFCPEPGSGSYSEANFNSQLEYKLQADDNCVQLTIENNGPYDSNPAADKVADPSGVLQVPAPSRPKAKTTGDGLGSGGCSITSNPVEPAQHAEWWLLGGLLTFMGWRRRKQQ